MTNEQQLSYNALIGAFQILANAHIQIVQGPQPTKEHNYDADIPNPDNHSGDNRNA